jgi:hypothetical protein
MNSKLYLTISAIVLFLYGISFVLFPAEASAPYGIPPEPPGSRHSLALH